MYTYTISQRDKIIFLFAILFFTAVLSRAQTINADSLKRNADTIKQNFQISFVPYLGTNGIYAGKTINRFSLNVIAGHSMGTDGFEAGGFANINKANVNGFQAAGFTNVVGGNVKGFQAAGFTNVVGKDVKGFQSAGFVNVVGGNVKGFQAAGFANVNRRNTAGFQAAGFCNVLGDTTVGGTFAGFINVTKVHTGLMAAGSINFAYYKSNGIQLAGLFNYADTLSKSPQIAGLFNFNRRSASALQIAGLFNYAKNVAGLQLAPFNFADTVTKGVPIGFLSVVRTGVHQLELGFDELAFMNVSIRTGTQKFYNVFTAGMVPVPNDSLKWTFGYGIGTSAKLSKRVNMDFTLSSNQINQGRYFDNLNMLNRLYIGVEYAIRPKIKIAAGPVINMFLVDTSAGAYTSYFKNLAPYELYTHTFNNDLKLTGWVGGKVAIRFF